MLYTEKEVMMSSDINLEESAPPVADVYKKLSNAEFEDSKSIFLSDKKLLNQNTYMFITNRTLEEFISRVLKHQSEVKEYMDKMNKIPSNAFASLMFAKEKQYDPLSRDNVIYEIYIARSEIDSPLSKNGLIATSSLEYILVKIPQFLDYITNLDGFIDYLRAAGLLAYGAIQFSSILDFILNDKLITAFLNMINSKSKNYFYIYNVKNNRLFNRPKTEFVCIQFSAFRKSDRYKIDYPVFLDK